MDHLEATAPGLYTFVLLLIALLGVLVIGGILFGIWKILNYDRRHLRTRFDSDEQEMETPMTAPMTA
jgi:hypothetical protein